MSYILEALRKSQQERDLGQVPTLDTLPSFSEGSAVATNYWGLAAVVLAALAVVIALYAALRGVPESIPELPPPTADVSERPLPAGPSAVPEATPGIPVRKVPGAVAPTQVAERAPSAARPAPAPAPVPAPAIQAPEDRPAAVRAAPPQERVRERAPPPPPPVVRTQVQDKVPQDLREEIDAFKQQVRRERGAGANKGAGVKKETEDVPPQKLRLPREVKDRLPPFLMTVHIYDEDPAKRFVLIDARKLREGGQTRDDMLVEEILPDGVVLSYEGHRFFQHR